jgi:hypothetical protein
MWLRLALAVRAGARAARTLVGLAGFESAVPWAPGPRGNRLRTSRAPYVFEWWSTARLLEGSLWSSVRRVPSGLGRRRPDHAVGVARVGAERHAVRHVNIRRPRRWSVGCSGTKVVPDRAGQGRYPLGETEDDAFESACSGTGLSLRRSGAAGCVRNGPPGHMGCTCRRDQHVQPLLKPDRIKTLLSLPAVCLGSRLGSST